jgi:hypothetical protein
MNIIYFSKKKLRRNRPPAERNQSRKRLHRTLSWKLSGKIIQTNKKKVPEKICTSIYIWVCCPAPSMASQILSRLFPKPGKKLSRWGHRWGAGHQDGEHWSVVLGAQEGTTAGHQFVVRLLASSAATNFYAREQSTTLRCHRPAEWIWKYFWIWNAKIIINFLLFCKND